MNIIRRLIEALKVEDEEPCKECERRGICCRYHWIERTE